MFKGCHEGTLCFVFPVGLADRLTVTLWRFATRVNVLRMCGRSRFANFPVPGAEKKPRQWRGQFDREEVPGQLEGSPGTTDNGTT